jgi:arylsulfatase A-like enzyme
MHRTPHSTPNILLITADQLRYDCVGASARYPVRTPHIDRLADEGMWFTDAFTHIPLCCPARQSLINGRRPESFGALWNFNIALRIPALSPDEYAWPRELAKRGYRSAFVGKWGVHPEHTPMSYGYERYIGEKDYARFVKERYPDVRYTNGFFGETNPVPVHDARTHWLARQAIDMMREFSGQRAPWHIALHFPEPHPPCRPSGAFAGMYDPASVPEWDSFRETFRDKPYIQRQQLYNWKIQDFTWQDWAPVVARYYGMISQIDDAIGLVLEALEQCGAADHTIVVLTADHGDLCGGHRMMDKHYVMYDDVVKVPLVVRWPGVVAAGQRCDRFVHPLLDIPPTILEVLGLDVPEFFHGRSLMPLWRGEEASEWRQAAVATYNGQQFGLYTQRMIRTREWKYVWNTTDVDELYNLREDPAELNNRIRDPQCKDVLKALRAELYEQLARDGDGLVLNEWMRDQLLLGLKI